MSRKAKNNKAIETPVVNNETPAEVLEVSPEELTAAIAAEQAEDANVAPADPVKLIVVRSLSTAGGKKAGADVVPIPQAVLDAVAEANLNTVNSIKSLYATGYSRAQIVAAGYNSSTVYRQVGEYIKSIATVKAEKAEVKENAEMLMEATGEGTLVDATEDDADETEAM